MKVLIIEDEPLAARKLQAMLAETDPAPQVVAVTDSVQSTLYWLQNNPSPDLAFVDIQLADDTSFEIFRQYKVQFPVIFVTAYDEYTLQAFEHNSVDYLLKPYTKERLQKTLDKLKQLEKHFLLQHVYQMIEGGNAPAGKTRFIARKGTEYVPVEAGQVAYFFSEHKITFIKTTGGQLYMLDKTLAELEAGLPAARFFRLNRKYIAAIDALKSFKPDGTGRLLVSLQPVADEEISVSREAAPAFRKWAGAGL